MGNSAGNWDTMEEEATRRKFERARLRHKRRVRNQMTAYMVVAILTIAAGAGLFIGGRQFVHVVAERRLAAQRAKEAEAAEATEETVAALEEEAAAAEEEQEQQTVETPEPAAEEEAGPTREELLGEYVDKLLADMPLKDKVAGMFLVTPEQLTGVDAAIKAGDGTQEALQDMAVGGLVYCRKNIKSEEQIEEMLSATRDMSKYPLFLATTEPGGDMGHLTESLALEQVASPAAIAENGDAKAAYEAGETLAKRLVKAGFSMNVAPAVNLTTESMNDEERALSFGSDPGTASILLGEEVRGFEENGIRTAVGLFPTKPEKGKGNIPTTDTTKPDLENGDFVMVQAAINAGCRIVQVGNLAAPRIVGDNTPCSMSTVIITELLRGDFGYDGIVMTDAMDDAVITDYYTADQAAVAAIKAGADVIYRPEDLQKAIEGVLEAVNSGAIPESRIDESIRRIYLVKCEGQIEE
ncbi:MAG: beta-N-acetylhexosaminidase [Lachnospiraceae bacterium]|nr:beta-N-acetylhexosaminidase [Lachnospiraceae bacterium]